MKINIVKILLIVIVITIKFGCLKMTKGPNTDREVNEEQVPRDRKFSYLFERKGRRNPFIGEGILTTTPTTTKTATNNKKKPPEHIKTEQPAVETGKPPAPIKKWPSDKEMAQMLRDTYKELDKICGRLFEDIIDSIENFEDISDEDFVKTFTNIYLLYRFYYQSKRGENLKKYTKKLKAYIKEIESIFNPVKYMYEYLETVFPEFQRDLINAQSKPSSFRDLKGDLSYINELLNSPLLSIRKKKFIEFIDKIKSQTRKKYKKLERNVDLYLELYKDFKAAGITVNGYIYNQDRIEDNVIFVGNETKKRGDTLWQNVSIVRIGKGEVTVNYKGNNLILHFLEE